MDIMTSYLKNVSFTFTGVFVNNFTSALIMIIGGILIGLPGLLLGFVNFMMLGSAFQIFGSKMGVLYFLAAVLPHGCFELTAIIISIGLGFKLASVILQWFAVKDSGIFHRQLLSIIKKTLIIVLPLLVLAAFIEVYITPHIVKLIK